MIRKKSFLSAADWPPRHVKFRLQLVPFGDNILSDHLDAFYQYSLTYINFLGIFLV